MAASVFSNVTIYSRFGTACVAIVAHAFHVPVLVCCEAYKFHERVLLDSICSNELGMPLLLLFQLPSCFGNYALHLTFYAYFNMYR